MHRRAAQLSRAPFFCEFCAVRCASFLHVRADYCVTTPNYPDPYDNSLESSGMQHATLHTEFLHIHALAGLHVESTLVVASLLSKPNA
eukprot:3514228-Amphidinium_carterae.1